VPRVPNSALSLSQHQDEDASENAQREALKKERPGGNLLREWRSSFWAPPCMTAATGPNSSPLPPTHSRQSCRIFALYLCRRHAWPHFIPGCPTIVQTPNRPRCCCAAEDGLGSRNPPRMGDPTEWLSELSSYQPYVANSITELSTCWQSDNSVSRKHQSCATHAEWLY
jgi:hypothetical protein